MGLYQQPGYKRLALVLPVLAAVGILILAISEDVVINEKPFVAMAVGAGSTYILIRIVYWIIDGFKSHE